MSNEEPLKRCPDNNCRGEARLGKNVLFGKTVWVVQCTKCGLRTSITPTAQGAIKIWNYRGKHGRVHKTR